MNDEDGSSKAGAGGLAPNVHHEDDGFDISGNKGFNFALFICWLTVLVSILGNVFFWLLNNSTEQAIKSKTTEKTEIISEISGPSLLATEQKAMAFKKAVNALSEVSKNRYSTDIFLTKLYAKIAQNVVVSNLSVASKGEISISGKTVTYRAVADQMTLLKEWQVNGKNILQGVELLSTSQALNEDTKKVETSFLISATIDKSQSLVEVATVPAVAPSALDSTNSATTDAILNEGGSDATIQ